MTIDYSVYRRSDCDEMAALLGEVFSQRDPPAVATGLTSADFEHFVRLLCPKAADEKLSIVARATETGEMVGALLAEDSASVMPEGMHTLSPRFDPVFDILGQLDAAYRKGQPPRHRECLHLFLLGVARSHTGRGIGHGLVTACLKHAAPHGFQIAVTEATNSTSQHIFRKQGFVERVRGSYRDHRFGDRAYFASIAEEHIGPILFDKALV